MHARQAAAFAAVEATGLSKSDIARIAGIHRSQVSRWVSGDQRPSYERTMQLAAHLRRVGLADLADELVAACGYGPAGAEPESLVPQEVIATLRRVYRNEPGKLQEAIEALEAIERERRGSSGEERSRDEGRSSGRRAG